MTDRRQWRVRLTAAAAADLQNILRWTTGHFGETQARLYGDTLARALELLTEGPRVVGARERTDIAKGLMTLHVGRGARKGRHFVLYRADSHAAPPVIDVLRLLHDSMDLARHVDPPDDDDS